MNYTTKSLAAGFSLVELIITIIVATAFLTSVAGVMSFINSSATDARQQEAASELAYNNLRMYANSEKPRWFDCIGDESSERTPPFSDGKSKPGATGQVLLENSSTNPINNLPGPVIQKVVAVAPYGCGESAAGMPIRIQSEVVYGPNNRKMVHATYVTY